VGRLYHVFLPSMLAEDGRSSFWAP